MANLIKIKDVQFFIGFGTPSENLDCAACKDLLNGNNIPYIFTIDINRSNYLQTFEEFNNWVFGLDFSQYIFNSWPIIIWYEYYDDYNVMLQRIFKNFKIVSLYKTLI